jgi:hypothetical protein
VIRTKLKCQIPKVELKGEKEKEDTKKIKKIFVSWVDAELKVNYVA